MELLLTSLVVALVIQVLFFIPAFIKKTDKVTDFAFGSTFIILAVLTLFKYGFSLPKLLLVLMISFWGIRLISYLLSRIKLIGRDKRFDDFRHKLLSFGFFFFAQGVLAWVVMIPSLYFLSSDYVIIDKIAILGSIIWAFGFCVEAISDKQKYKFKINPLNKGKWIQSGLWKYSRHPNYFGEALCWIGIYTFVYPSLTALQAVISLISPIAILAFLLIFTGIPPLEKKYDKIYKNNKEYQAYKRKTSIFFLLPPKV